MSFDIESFLRFSPAKFWCQKCFALWKRPSLECDKDQALKFLICRVCNVKYVTTEQYSTFGIERYLSTGPSNTTRPLNRVQDLIAHSTTLASIARDFKSKSKVIPPFRSLLKALIHAKSFVHFVSYGISPVLLGILKMTAQYAQVKGVVSGNVGENILSEVTDFQNEAPALSIRFWKHGSFRSMDEPHHKLIVIDGLLAFKGSSNLTPTSWRSAVNGMEMIEIVTDIDEVIKLNNQFFSPLWGKVSEYGDEIVMEDDDVPF